MFKLLALSDWRWEASKYMDGNLGLLFFLIYLPALRFSFLRVQHDTWVLDDYDWQALQLHLALIT